MEQIVEQERAEDEQRRDDSDGGDGMSGGKPSQPDGEQVFAKTQSPIAERFGNGVDGRTGGGFGAVRSERDASGKKRCGPAPFLRRSSGGTVSEDGGGRRPDERVDGVPDGIEKRNFVGEKLNDVQRDGDAEDDRMGYDGKGRRQMNHAEALQQTESGDGGVEVQAGGEACAKSQAERLQRVHNF